MPGAISGQSGPWAEGGSMCTHGMLQHGHPSPRQQLLATHLFKLYLQLQLLQ